MTEWLKNQYDINIRSNAIFASSTIQLFFKQKERKRNIFLIEEHQPGIQKSQSLYGIKTEKTKNNKEEKTTWRRLSLQNFKNKKRDQRCNKPMIPQVLYTYDHRGLLIDTGHYVLG
ncbi:uncharacterized protein LOC115891299 [Sitophilus oryzae]|uniref:Uncharacterized protein LOC115891299 n=1 Tax=Sitophilus oryzae TaxID=7048 RepID=A0A6J2YU16_SITOR|nr:uncharacterized protein LOC115891299 [Sitophilus oryzae]